MGCKCGQQLFKDGQWVGVEPIPHAFTVNIGHILQVHNYYFSFLMAFIENTSNGPYIYHHSSSVTPLRNACNHLG